MNKISQTTISIKNKDNYLYSRIIDSSMVYFIASKAQANKFIECSNKEFKNYSDFYTQAIKVKRDLKED